jgi:hypothetical protein
MMEDLLIENQPIEKHFSNIVTWIKIVLKIFQASKVFVQDEKSSMMAANTLPFSQLTL